ncbi:excalibur calcium-binding domain-containing protein [Novosphingobium sp. BL-8H]|uniref:excalibur calcium-binding domain-containing protein n=1 Tax=Novosphingobium sp. BL-8H TaxID=3127640 RepID=UPI0037577110
MGYLSTQGDEPLQAVQQLLPSSSSAVSPKSWAYYANCDEARAAGEAPLYVDEPGYRLQLDADGDGIACEPYRGSHSHRRRLRFHF